MTVIKSPLPVMWSDVTESPSLMNRYLGLLAGVRCSGFPICVEGGEWLVELDSVD